MKRLLLPLLLLLLSGCKYGSQFEAIEACMKKWEGLTDKGSQTCQTEKATNQVLGVRLNEGETKVIKRFKY